MIDNVDQIIILERDMEALNKKAVEAHNRGFTPDSMEVQRLVDEWAGIIARNINKPINKRFMEIFKERVNEMSGKQVKRYWEIVCRISPERKGEYEANQLLASGLDYKLRTYT